MTCNMSVRPPMCAGSCHPDERWRLVLLRRFVTFGWFESFAVVAGPGLGLSATAPVGPVQHVTDRGASTEDEFGVEAADFVAAQRDERFSVAVGAPFAASAARVATRNA